MPSPFVSTHLAPVDINTITTPLAYVIHRQGVSVYRKGVIADTLVHHIHALKTEEIDHLPVMRELFHLNIPRLPWAIAGQVIAFFREVAKDRLEAYVQILYHPEEDRWDILVPEQVVTSGSVKHDAPRGHRDGWLHVWDIHSHQAMGAFFSTTDDEDEGRSARLFGVIGNLDKGAPEIKARVSDGMGGLINTHLRDVWDVDDLDLEVEVRRVPFWDALRGKHESTVVRLPDFPPEWLGRLTRVTGSVKHAGIVGVVTTDKRRVRYPLHEADDSLVTRESDLTEEEIDDLVAQFNMHGHMTRGHARRRHNNHADRRYEGLLPAPKGE